ncbi:hypothetical protein VNO77_22594 [Canavalia gladiata]|uniref:Uncharacterized protein n=1 Tax=Canavalia gladiata TaxID=3824 RepID=A0AAN9L2V6_CANGL
MLLPPIFNQVKSKTLLPREIDGARLLILGGGIGAPDLLSLKGFQWSSIATHSKLEANSGCVTLWLKRTSLMHTKISSFWLFNKCIEFVMPICCICRDYQERAHGAQRILHERFLPLYQQL